MLFGTIAVLSSLGLVALGSLVYVAFAYDRRVAVTTTSLVLPRPTRLGLSCDEIEIPLKSVLTTGIHDFIGSSKVLRIQYDTGVIHIPSNMFQNKKAFAEMVDVLAEAIERNQSGEAS